MSVRRLVAIVTEFGVIVLAALAVALGVAGAPFGRLVLVAAWVGLALKLVQRTRRRGSALGTFLTIRGLVIAGTAVALARTAGAAGWVAVLSGALLMAMLAGEPLLRRAAGTRVPVSEHLPGLPPKPPPPTGNPSVPIASLLATGVGVLTAWFAWSPGWWLLAGALAVTPAALLVAVVRHRRNVARRLRVLVPEAVASYAPDFLIYTSRPDDASYQVRMWLPYLERTGRRFIIVTRNRIPAQALAGLTDAPVIEARGMAQLESLLVDSLKAAFYVNASSGNGELVRHPQLTHVYLGHGDSDKPPSYNPTHAMYDQIFASGPAAIRRYAAHDVYIPEHKFRIVGRPQVELVEPAGRPISEVAEPVVLYAPTWRGHVEETMLYSLPQGEQIVAALLARGATVIFRPHPFSYSFGEDRVAIAAIQALLARDAQDTHRPHLWGPAAETELGILDCINASDAMVSDVSSVVSDYLFSNKPFTMVAVPSPPEEFVDQYPVARGAYVVRADLSDLGEALNAMLGPDPLAERRTSIKIDYLGDFPAETYASAFVAAAAAACASGGQSTEETPESEEGPEAEEEAETEAAPSAPEEAEEEAPPRPGEDEEAPPRPGEDAESGIEAAAAPTETAVTAPARRRRWPKVPRATKRELATTGAAALALAASVLGAPTGVVAGAAVLTVGLMAWYLHRAMADRRRWAELLLRFGIARGILLAPLATLAVRAEIGLVATSLTCALLAAAVLGERYLSAATRRPSVVVLDFPAADPPKPPVLSAGLQPQVWAAGFLLTVGLAVARAPGVLLVAGAALVILLLVVLLLRAPRWREVIEAGDQQLREALLELSPQFAVYFASSAGARYQLGMWLPYFDRIGRPFVIVSRNLPMMREIAEATHGAGVAVPIIYRPTLRSVEEVIVPSLRAAFYVNNAVRNTHFIERRELAHVWLNHGDSEKPACYNPVHAIYDLIFAAGQAGVDRYARHGVTIPQEKFRIVGRPQVESIEPARGPVIAQHPPTVLYAPTWQGPFTDSRLFSLPQGADIVRFLLGRGVRVVFRAHPFNYRYRDCIALITEIGRILAEDRQRTGIEHLWGAAAEQELDITGCFNVSDAMICDVSAVVSDYLQSDKPLSIVSVGRTPEELVVEAPAAKAAYVLAEDLSNLDEVVDQLLVTDPLSAVRRDTRVYYLSEFKGQPYAEGFLSAARSVIDAEPRDPAAAEDARVESPAPHPEPIGVPGAVDNPPR